MSILSAMTSAAKWSLYRAPSIAAVILLVFTFIFDVHAEAWRTYFNSRFGTTAQVPLNWHMEPPPVNGDGRRFTSPNGRAEISIYGSFAESPASEPDGSVITYKKQGEVIKLFQVYEAIQFFITRKLGPVEIRSGIIYGSSIRSPTRKNMIHSSRMFPTRYAGDMALKRMNANDGVTKC